MRGQHKGLCAAIGALFGITLKHARKMNALCHAQSLALGLQLGQHPVLVGSGHHQIQIIQRLPVAGK